jgi:hypothetical protein
MATEASSKQAPAENAEGRRRTFLERVGRPLLFFRRIPTPVLVTLLGIVLSAWLLPAITRQWEDRQKAHDLQAAIVSDMAAATARMLTRTERIHAGASAKEGAGESDDWLLSSFTIEARLKAYFPQRLVRAWQLYSYFVSYFDPTAKRQAGSYETERAAGDLGKLRDEGMVGMVVNLGSLAPLIDKKRTEREKKLEGVNDVYGALYPELTQDEYAIFAIGDNPSWKHASRKKRLAEFEERLISMEAYMANRVLATGPNGYSTSFRDFIHDLIP